MYFEKYDVEYTYTTKPTSVLYDDFELVKLYKNLLHDKELTIDEAICLAISIGRSKQNMGGVETQFYCRVTHLCAYMGVSRKRTQAAFKGLIDKGFLAVGPGNAFNKRSFYVLTDKTRNYDLGTTYFPYAIDTFWATLPPMRERVVLAALQFCHSTLKYKEVFGTTFLSKLTGIKKQTLDGYMKRLLANNMVQRRMVTHSDLRDSMASSVSPSSVYYAYSIPGNDGDIDDRVKKQHSSNQEFIDNTIANLGMILQTELREYKNVRREIPEIQAYYYEQAGEWVAKNFSDKDVFTLKGFSRECSYRPGTLILAAKYDKDAWERNKKGIIEWASRYDDVVAAVFAAAYHASKIFPHARSNAWHLFRFLKEHAGHMMHFRVDADHSDMAKKLRHSLAA